MDTWKRKTLKNVDTFTQTYRNIDNKKEITALAKIALLKAKPMSISSLKSFKYPWNLKKKLKNEKINKKEVTVKIFKSQKYLKNLKTLKSKKYRSPFLPMETEKLESHPWKYAPIH